MKKYKFIFLISLFPFIVSAQATDFDSFLGIMQGLLNDLFPILTALAVIVFLWGVLKYIKASDNPEKRTEGRNLMVYGIIAIFVMVSLWGLINIIVNTFFNTADLTIGGGDVPQY